MVEYFDVLNERGEFVNKTASREECHKQGFWHKAIVVFIVNSKNQVLLQRRSKNKKLWPDMWDVSSGGHVLAGEWGYQAGMREVKEELGIDINKNDMTFLGCSISSQIKNDIKNNHFNEFYIVHKDLDEKNLKLQLEEVSEVKWVDKEEIINRIKNNYEGITNKQGCWEYLLKFYNL